MVDPCLRWLQPGESEMGRVGGRVTPVVPYLPGEGL